MRKRLDISKNPIFSKLIGKPLRKSPIVFNEKVNVALAIIPETRVTIRDNPSLILKFLKFVREGRNSATTKAFSFKRLKSPNSFLVETKSQKLYVRKIEQTNKEKPWGNHAYNSALIMSELEKQGVNTVPVEFAYSNLKKGESYIAYDYRELQKLQTFEKAKKAKTITESEIKEFEDNIEGIYHRYKYKVLSKLKKTKPTREELLISFYEENQVLFNPETRKFVVFNPEVDLRRNKIEYHKKFTAVNYQL
jgi:hypothetical protein